MATPETFPEDLLSAVRQMRHEKWYLRQDLFRDDDIWLASYPRSGSHFARFILVSARYFLQYGKFPSDLSGMKAIPDVHGCRLEFAEGTPRILRVVHLIRNPRDVIIS